MKGQKMIEGQKKHKVLVVDDTPENIDVLMETLKSDYKMVAALNGEKALRVAASSNPPDLILLDIMMPGMSGYEVCARLKADGQTQNIPVIFLSALSAEQDEARGLRLGAIDYITKPFSPELIRARIRNQMELKHYRDQLEVLVQKRTSQLHSALEKLKGASLSTIFRLSRAAEYRDEDTGAHILRMSSYAAAIARHMGLGEQVAHRIRYAAPMHDVGKIGIPDHILLKPGKLDGREWEMMKQHSTIGGLILKGEKAGYVKLAEVIALTHHEKWDGSGYPHGLTGKQIPMVGQIVAVADVFDALTSKRPYKPAFTLDKSYGIIEEGREQNFHPAVVDAFFDIESEILAIKAKYKDEDNSLLFEMAGKLDERP